MSSQYSDDKIKSAQAKAQAVTAIARENITLSLAQNERLEDMETKAAHLESQGREFHRGARALKRKFCLQAYRLACLIVVLLAVIILVIVFAIKAKSDN